MRLPYPLPLPKFLTLLNLPIGSRPSHSYIPSQSHPVAKCLARFAQHKLEFAAYSGPGSNLCCRRGCVWSAGGAPLPDQGTRSKRLIVECSLRGTKAITLYSPSYMIAAHGKRKATFAYVLKIDRDRRLVLGMSVFKVPSSSIGGPTVLV